MKLEEVRVLFFVVVAIVALLVASPALSTLLVYPRTDFFTEFSILGPNGMAEDYPYNITRGQSYRVYLGIANYLGYMAYYVVEVKFRNSTQSEPSLFGPSSNQTPSTLPSLYNITAFVADQSAWEMPLNFSFNYRVNTTLSTVQMQTLTLNNVDLNISNCSIAWDSQRRVFSGYLFFELWIYNSTPSVFKYHQRWLQLSLNMTTA
jgi:hypothetical protein